MYFIRYRVQPSETHPQRGRFGEGVVCCWIDRRTLKDAARAARLLIEESHWDVAERETAGRVTEADYADDPWLAYYRQAVTDGEVFLYHLSPRYPVYLVSAVVERASPRERAEAVYFVSGESLLRAGETDVSEPDFWNAGRRRRAVAAARRAIRGAGWVVGSVGDHRPCGRDDLAEDMVVYYDEAESDGACLVFLRSGDEEPDGVTG